MIGVTDKSPVCVGRIGVRGSMGVKIKFLVGMGVPHPGVFWGCISKERGCGRKCAHLWESKGDERGLGEDGCGGTEARRHCSKEVRAYMRKCIFISILSQEVSVGVARRG